MTDRQTVGDLDPDREVYVEPSANVGARTRAHLHNDAEECWYTGDLRPVAARVLFDDQPVCKICADRDRRGANQYTGAAEVADD